MRGACSIMVIFKANRVSDWIFIIKVFSDYCLHLYCYFHKVSADISSGFLQVFVELGNLHGTSNYVLYWNHRGCLFWFHLPYPGTSVKYSCILLACSEDWTCNLQMIVFLEAQGTNAYNRYAMCPVEITIKMKTIVRKTLMIKINKLRLRNLDNLVIGVQILDEVGWFSLDKESLLYLWVKT